MPRKFRSLQRLSLFAGLLLSPLGCNDTTAVEVVAVAAVRLMPTQPTLTVGQSLRLSATPVSATGAPLTDRPVSWVSDDPSLASILNDGTVTAHLEGAVTLRATSEGVSAQVRLLISPIAAATLQLDIVQFTRKEGERVTLRAVVRDATGTELPGRFIAWSSENPAIATVSADGEVTAVSEGSTRIVANHAALVATSSVTVTPPYAGDLLFDMYAAEPLPRIFQIDPRVPSASPVSLFGTAGTWEASVSPDGSQIAFTCNENGPAICVADRYGAGLRALTSETTMYEDQPAWSPDGTSIAFRRWNQGGPPGPFNPADIWVMRPDGTGQRNVTADALPQSQPSWSPNAEMGHWRIMYVEEELVNGYLYSNIESIRATGTNRVSFTEKREYVDREPTWSPDGTRLLYTRSGGTLDGELWVFNRITGDEHALLPVTLAGEQLSPAWSPDGRFVAFTSKHEPDANMNYFEQIYVVRADGSGMTRRTSTGNAKANPTWLRAP